MMIFVCSHLFQRDHLAHHPAFRFTKHRRFFLQGGLDRCSGNGCRLRSFGSLPYDDRWRRAASRCRARYGTIVNARTKLGPVWPVHRSWSRQYLWQEFLEDVVFRIVRHCTQSHHTVNLYVKFCPLDSESERYLEFRKWAYS